LYENPRAYNVYGRIKEFAELEDNENAVVICQLSRLERRDENETVRAAKRGYEKKGQTLFLDAFMVDDSVSKPVVVRVRPNMWFTVGEPMADRAVGGQDWFLIRGRWSKQFSMLIVQKVRCLTNKELFK
jgi:hypothetical protein